MNLRNIVTRVALKYKADVTCDIYALRLRPAGFLVSHAAEIVTWSIIIAFELELPFITSIKNYALLVFVLIVVGTVVDKTIVRTVSSTVDTKYFRVGNDSIYAVPIGKRGSKFDQWFVLVCRPAGDVLYSFYWGVLSDKSLLAIKQRGVDMNTLLNPSAGTMTEVSAKGVVASLKGIAGKDYHKVLSRMDKHILEALPLQFLIE